MSRCSFTPLDSRLADLVVEGASPGIRCQPLGPTANHGSRFGLGRYELTLPPYPDEALEVHPKDDGDFVVAEAWPSPEVKAWAQHSAVKRGAGVLAELPEGRYRLILSASRPHLTERVALGNNLVMRPAWLWPLFTDREYRVLVVAPTREGDLSLDQPLVAVPILNYTGDTLPVGVMLFPLSDPTPADPAEDLLIALPLTGELVLDTMDCFKRPDATEDRTWWRDTAAATLAQRLAESPAAR